MAQRLEKIVGRGIPWSDNAAWWLVLLEGIIAVGLGLAIVVHPGDARDVIVRIVGVYLLVTGLLGLFGDVRRWRSERVRASALRHGIMIVVGVVAALKPGVTGFIAAGMIVVGLIGLILALMLENLGPARWGVLLSSALSLLLGFLLIWALATGSFLIGIVGLGLLLVGCGLIAWAVRSARGHRAAVTPARV